nr:uracil phosphoribosyltransferase [Naematelia aurantialba]
MSGRLEALEGVDNPTAAQVAHALRPPLPEAKYPPETRHSKPAKGFFMALVLVLGVWMITPLSGAYLIWYILLGPFSSGRTNLTATIFAAYALTEVLFAVYTAYLIRFVQGAAPTPLLTFETRNELFMRILRIDLALPMPTRPAPDEDESMHRLFALYAVGQISAATYHHARDAEYEDMHGMGAWAGLRRRRVGRMTPIERQVISAFVEETPGDREDRLRKEVEHEVGAGWDDFDDETSLVDKQGRIVMLHPMDRRAVEFRESLRTWFDHAPWESIKRTNMLVWLSWSCFNRPYEEVSSHDEWRTFLEKSITMLEARTGMLFPEGYSKDVKIIRLTLDPVNARGRPLILYALTNAINWGLEQVVYPFAGMGHYKEGDIEYLIRIPAGWTPEKGRIAPNAIPVIYLHGLGFGLLQSHLVIKHLLKSLPTHPILVPISRYTSQAFFHPRFLRPWTRTELVDGIKAICTRWGFWAEPQTGMGSRSGGGGVSLMSHSNGSVAHGWILKDCPSLVRRSAFVDPVVFCLWQGDVCHSFCYRKPSSALELLLYYFISTEIGIAHYIQRHFDWADNTLFLDEIPNATDPSKTAFFLGGRDIIVDARRVRRYLEAHGVKTGLHWDANAGHGDGLAGAARDRVVMYVGTGTTDNWPAWLSSGRRSHSLGTDDWNRFLRGGVAGQRPESEEDSDQTLVDKSSRARQKAS